MSPELEGAVPPPHSHHLSSNKSWPSYEGLPYKLPRTPSPSQLPMSPESLHSYLPNPQDDTVPGAQNFGGVPTTGWYGPSAPAPIQSQTGFASYGYDQPYVTPHTSSIGFSPQQFPKTANAPNPNHVHVKAESQASAFSPASHHSRMSEPGQPEFGRPTVAESATPYIETPRTSNEAHPSFPAPIKTESNPPPPTRPHSSPSSFTPNPNQTSVDFNWSMNPLGISTTMPEQYYAGAAYASVRPNSPQWRQQGGFSGTMPANIFAPQPRRMYAPIAPHPLGPNHHQRRTVFIKRSVDDNDNHDEEYASDSKKRKRSASNVTTPQSEFVMSEEERLLLQLKEDESLPWKDIAARFQSDLGKTYQVAALQMRLNRLKTRMRQWTETDDNALRMAYDYWARQKFDIIRDKMVEFGVQEKWPTKHIERRWREIEPGSIAYPATYAEQYQHPNCTPSSYAPYSMSPVEPPTFMPYMP